MGSFLTARSVPRSSFTTKTDSLLARNENWRNDQEMVLAEMILAPPNDDEAAIVVILTPGSGRDSERRDSPGAALLEVFALNQEKEALALLAEFRSSGWISRGGPAA